MARIALFETDEAERRHLERLLSGHELRFFPGPLGMENVHKAANCDALVVFIYSGINRKILGRLPRLKLIATMSTGYDHIDTKACRKRGITVCNVPAYGEATVAEHTLALMLAISRKIIPSVERTRKGDFSLEGLTGFDLNGKTLGIVGTGKIGSYVARLAHCFGMKLIAFSKHKNPELEKRYCLRYVKTLGELLRNSDIITLHAPLDKSTFHMLNRRNMKAVKKGAVLINTARGALVETEALLGALRDGTINYAGLDVLEGEAAIREEKELLSAAFRKRHDLRTALANHMLQEMDNVIITPHNAFNSGEALLKIVRTTSGSINAFFRGEKVASVE